VRQHEFLFQPARIGALLYFRQPRFQPRAQCNPDIRQPAAHVGDDARDCFEAFAQEYAETFAFALARREHVVERAIEQIERRLAQAFLIDFLAQQQAGPGKQTGEVDADSAEPRADASGRAHELFEHGIVDADLAGAGIGRLEAQVDVDLAARQLGGGTLAQYRLDRAQFFGQARIELEIAVIDRAQLERKRAPAGLGFRTREGGHAADHGRGFLLGTVLQYAALRRET
jgi:hypothetical protein